MILLLVPVMPSEEIFSKVSNYIFIVTPKNVDLAGDFQEIMAGAFDVPSI